MEYEQDLKEICVAFAAALPEKVSVLQADWNQLKQQNEIPSNEFIRKVHSLIGAGATFGFSSLSTAAKEFELALRLYQQQETKLTTDLVSLEPLFLDLKSAAQHPCKYNFNLDSNPLLGTANIVDNDTRSILIISSNQYLTTDLTRELSIKKMASHVISSTSNLQSTIEQINPSCIVLELTSNKNPIEEINRIKEVKQRFYNTPSLLIISNHHDISVRLLAVKAGATGYFLTPVYTRELVKSIHRQCYPTISPAYRILIVDDDEQFAHHTALILQRTEANFDTKVLTQPLKILETVENFQPEVILLDFYMPDCDGIELATVIRQQCIYAEIAIVFFSVETAIDHHIDGLRAGGEDFLLKSIPPNQLVAKLEAKANNTRTIQSLMLHDGLTGLLNRSHLIETISQQISVSQRYQNWFSYVILELDHLKQVNEKHGHSTGNEVLKSFAKVIRQRLRAIDSVFRFGGKEFVAVLPDTQANKAESIINDLLDKFRSLEFSSREQPFFVTFSAGIAQYPDCPDSFSLAEAANKALYMAKAAGRNRVYLATDIEVYSE